jgi:hypothetical protein
MRKALFFLSLVISSQAFAQEMTAVELLDQSIRFHDPMNTWSTSELELIIEMELPERESRVSKITINNREGSFKVSYVSKGHLLEYTVDAMDSATVYADFQEVTGRMDMDSIDLSQERARRWRNYYSYLYGLPMKLKDEGTIIDPEVGQDYFNGESVLSIRVTYDEAVGSDIWYYYFHPETYAMVGYRFYHDESINDGEFIVMDDMEIQNGMRIPKNRFWYVNEDARFLGADMMISLEVK